MTESNPKTTQAAQAAAPANKPAPSQAGTPAPAKKSTGAPGRKKGYGWVVAFIVVLLLAAALAAALWYQHRQFKTVTTALASQARASADAADNARQQAQQALAGTGQQARQLAALQASLEKSQEQIHTLEQAFQNLTDSGSDIALINDVDRVVTIANQQLTLNGNVANAIVALETAQTRLARANRPGLASLQQTINGDLDSLRAASVVDVAALTSQLNQLGDLLGHASLLVPDAAAPALASATPAANAAPQAAAGAAAHRPGWRGVLDDVGAWSHTVWTSAGRELERLVSIRRVSDPAALLMSPDQAGQLRQNLRLRVMTAQLALMMRQPAIWTSETQALAQALETRYDATDPRTRKAIKLAADLEQTRIDVKLPTLNNSLQALQSLREAQSKQEESSAAPDAPQAPQGADAAAAPKTGKTGAGQPAASQE